MGSFGIDATFDPLRAVRVHAPGIELWTRRVGGSPGPPETPVGPNPIRREHARLVKAVESAGVTVHRLAEDVATSGGLDDIVSEHVRAPGPDALAGILEGLGPREQLGLALARARLDRTDKAATTIHVDRPLSMAYRLCDTTIVGDRGPILPAMSDPDREPEVSIAEAAWEGVGAEIVHRADPAAGPIEGADYLPLGEFGLLGVGGVVDGKEVVRTTARDAARALLEADALGVPEVALVRSPVAVAQGRFDGHPRSTPGPLTAWCNVAAEGLAVLDAHLAREADVHVHVSTDAGYEHDRTTTLLSYLESKGYDWIGVGPTERWPTSFLTIEDGVVVPTYEPDSDGEYHAELNPTIEALAGHGVTVHPDGVGVPGGALADAGYGVHAMTCPIERG